MPNLAYKDVYTACLYRTLAHHAAHIERLYCLLLQIPRASTPHSRYQPNLLPSKFYKLIEFLL